MAAISLAGEARNWIHRFKYPGRGLAVRDPSALAVARDLALAVAKCAGGERPHHVLPIPLHPKRFRTRGFNPAGFLAAEIAHFIGVSSEPGWLRRIRDTPPQAGLDAAGRRQNVAGAFRCCAGEAVLRSRRIWLVDDVVTTGVTLAEAAAQLTAAGAGEIIGVCLARTRGESQIGR